MSDTSASSNALAASGPLDPEELIPLVYSELRRIAAAKMARENPDHTLQPTALVHEAWLRIASEGPVAFRSRAQFFAAAAEAMRRILIENVRRKRTLKRGGAPRREPLDAAQFPEVAPPDEVLAVHDALDQLSAEDTRAADLVKLRYFVGLTMEEAANAMDLPLRSAERLWTYARAWLRRSIGRPLS